MRQFQKPSFTFQMPNHDFMRRNTTLIKPGKWLVAFWQFVVNRWIIWVESLLHTHQNIDYDTFWTNHLLNICINFHPGSDWLHRFIFATNLDVMWCMCSCQIESLSFYYLIPYYDFSQSRIYIFSKLSHAVFVRL